MVNCEINLIMLLYAGKSYSYLIELSENFILYCAPSPILPTTTTTTVLGWEGMHTKKRTVVLKMKINIIFFKNKIKKKMDNPQETKFYFLQTLPAHYPYP